MSPNEFLKDFVWGVATASYQIEGAWDADGKGESIWDRFSHTPGKVENGDTGDIACDHYHRWPEDVALMKSLGVRAYRFSLSWPRILPKGRGQINQPGLDFYSGLVDGLLEAGITPYITLYHWDLPQKLQDSGGWPARSTAESFVEYADFVSRQLGDRVKFWMTLNEPWVSANNGYLEGRHAPGHKDIDEMLSSAHHLLLAHGMSVSSIRNNVVDAQVGIVLNLSPFSPASPSEADIIEASIGDGILNRWYLDPLSGRGYPKDVQEHFARSDDYIHTGDMDAIAVPIDFLGVNYYARSIARSDSIPEEENAPREVFLNDEITEMGWEVHADGLADILERVHRDYSFPAFYVTENGAAYDDALDENQAVNDLKRIDYLRGHIRACGGAIENGVPLKGYFVWSFLDNFEWAFGYSKRFGIVYVDFYSLERTCKKSAHWYAKVIANNGIVEV
ncbi:MAG: GH1 family beta-glucosidase [Anaerolineales bacterium]